MIEIKYITFDLLLLHSSNNKFGGIMMLHRFLMEKVYISQICNVSQMIWHNVIGNYSNTYINISNENYYISYDYDIFLILLKFYVRVRKHGLMPIPHLP